MEGPPSVIIRNKQDWSDVEWVSHLAMSISTKYQLKMCPVFRSTPGVYTSLVAMTDKINTLVQQASAVGSKAKVRLALMCTE